MKTSKYLYGNISKELLLKRKEIAKEFRDAANRLIEVLYEIPMEARDDERLGEIVKARDFNQRIIDEEI